jgi:hypothetical protein
MSIVNRRNAVIGWATWTTVKRIAAFKAKRVATAATPARDDGGSEGKGKAVKVIAVAAAAAGAVVFWKKRHRDATDYDSLASEEIRSGGDVPPAE